MLGRFGKDAGSLLGVEIAADSVRMLQLQRRHGRCSVIAWARQPLPSPLRSDWTRDSGPLLKALRTAYQRSGSRCREVAVALPGAEVICKVCRLPAGLSASQMEARLLTDAERLFPFALEDLAMDFQVLGPAPEPAGDVEVLVAACRQRSLEALEQLFAEAGLRVAAVEVDGIALQRVLPGTQRLLRIETAAASLHGWSRGGLPERQEVSFEPADTAAQRLQRVVRLLMAGEGPGRPPGLLIGADDDLASGWTSALRQRLGITCGALQPLAGLASAEWVDRQALSGMTCSMALAYGLALGGGT